MVTSRVSSTAKDFDPAEIRRLVQLGRDRGLIRGGDVAEPIAKDGEEAAAMGGLRSQWMEVDPETAKRWLENNFVNRPLVDDVVIAYARDMLNGVWVPTHQGVAFNDADELIDGQHRLSAIVRTGVTVRMMVTFGLPARIEGKEMTTMDAVDRGRTRSVADQLKIQHGLKEGGAIAQICAALGYLCFQERTRRLSVGQTLEIYRAFEHAITWVLAHRSHEHGLRTAGVLAGFAFALATERGLEDGASNPVSLAFENFVSGDLAAESALGQLRAFVTSVQARLLNRGTNRGVADLVLQAVYLQTCGRAAEKLAMRDEGADYYRGKQQERAARIARLFAVQRPEAAT